MSQQLHQCVTAKYVILWDKIYGDCIYWSQLLFFIYVLLLALPLVLPIQQVSTSAVLKKDDNQSHHHYIDCILPLMVKHLD